MKSLCAYDNVFCLIQNLPDTMGQIGLIVLLLVIVPAIFATLTYRQI